MPQLYENGVITDAGAALLARIETSTARLEVTRVVTGAGVYSSAEKAESALRTRTALKDQRNQYTPSSVSVTDPATIKITALISNEDPVTGDPLVTSGYFINEIGVYCKEYGAAASTEVLYCIAVAAMETGDYMPPYEGGGASQITQSIYLTVGNAATTYVTIAGAAALATDLADLATRVGDLETFGFSVVDGVLNVTYEEEG